MYDHYSTVLLLNKFDVFDDLFHSSYRIEKETTRDELKYTDQDVRRDAEIVKFIRCLTMTNIELIDDYTTAGGVDDWHYEVDHA
jgi:hypothetical protein